MMPFWSVLFVVLLPATFAGNISYQNLYNSTVQIHSFETSTTGCDQHQPCNAGVFGITTPPFPIYCQNQKVKMIKYDRNEVCKHSGPGEAHCPCFGTNPTYYKYFRQGQDSLDKKPEKCCSGTTETTGSVAYYSAADLLAAHDAGLANNNCYRYLAESELKWVDQPRIKSDLAYCIAKDDVTFSIAI